MEVPAHPVAQQLSRRWQHELVEFIGADRGRSALVIGRGAAVGIADDVVRPGASVHKLFVAIAVMLAGARGELDLSATVAVDELPPTRYPSVTAALAADHRLTLAELAALMLATSDNRIAARLIAMLGPAAITSTARSIGCDATELRVGFGDDDLGPAARSNVTSVRDCATALAVIATDPACAALRPALRSSLFNSRILARLPDEIVVSHKTGSLAGVVNDVGVIHAPGGDVTLCVLSDGQADRELTSAAIARCARGVFDAVHAFDTALAAVGAGAPAR